MSFGGFYHYQLISRFLSPALHGKLCWSEAGQVLCSVASDGTIYGWDIEKTAPIFQVTRHSDLITDLIAVNRIGMFITCSMDKRIVMWSAVNRRVQAVWSVHERGVRCLHYYETTLLSGGYDCDARTFDIVTKENVALLRGDHHQHHMPCRHTLSTQPLVTYPLLTPSTPPLLTPPSSPPHS